MSIQIPCPVCGPRSVEEFVFGEIPRVPDSITDENARDVDRGFMHENPEGPVEERWFHAAGCRRWVTVRRDTRTDALLGPQAGSPREAE